MNQKKAKMIRREVDSIIGGSNMPYALHEFHPSNPDIAQAVKSRGFENVVKEWGYAPLTCMLTSKCRRYHYQKAKRI